MLVFPQMYGGSSTPSPGGASYVSNGLIFRDDNCPVCYASNRRVSVSDRFNVLGSNNSFTMEIYARVDAIPSGSYSRMFEIYGTSNCAIGLSMVSSEKDASSDYSINMMYGMDQMMKAPNLLFGYKHTFTLVFYNDTIYLYIDGANTGETLSCSIHEVSPDTIYMMTGYTGGRSTTGEWYSARVYDRALSVSEVALNHTADISNFGA